MVSPPLASKMDAQTATTRMMKARNALARIVQKRGKKFVIEVDDTASASSTHSVESKDRKTVLMLNVSIDESQNIYHEPIKIDFDEEGEQLWYSSAECKEMKFENNATVRALSQCSSADLEAYIGALAAAYVACRDVGNVSQAQVQEMRNQDELCPQHFGMEQRLAKSATTDKLKRRNTLVFLACNVAKSNLDLPLEEVEEMMRTKCEEVTLPARLFAGAIGRAHACEASF